MNLTIIGFGSFGQAIASLVKTNAHVKISAWDLVDTGDACQVSDVSEAVAGANVVFFAVPSAFFADCLKGIAGVPQQAVLVAGTKGIDPVSGKSPFELLQKTFPNNPVAVLSGPMLAEEITRGVETCATVAAKDRKIFASVLEVFENTPLKLCFTKDLIGVSLAGVLKNVYTLAFGLSDGLQMGANFKSCVVLQAIKEMQAIIQVLGGEASTMMTHAGLGDLLATGYSLSSRNYSYGFGLGGVQGNDNKATVEGIKNIETILAKLPDKNSFPLICAVEEIFLKDVPAKERLLQALRVC